MTNNKNMKTKKILIAIFKILFYIIKIIFKMLKNKWFYFIAIFVVILPALFYYGLWKGYEYVDNWENQVFSTGYEIGRFEQLQEDAESAEFEIKQKQAKSKETLLKNLAQLESGNGEVRKLLDTNNRYSLGLYHFQAHTVQDLYKRYYGKKITIMQAVEIAENDELATKLAHDAIFVKKELFHWKISLCKLGMITRGCLTQAQINKLVMR